jgi:hypothetical protein
LLLSDRETAEPAVALRNAKEQRVIGVALLPDLVGVAPLDAPWADAPTSIASTVIGLDGRSHAGRRAGTFISLHRRLARRNDEESEWREATQGVTNGHEAAPFCSGVAS